MSNTRRKIKKPEALCIAGCGRPVRRYKNGSAAITCGRPECLLARRQQIDFTGKRHGFGGWPKVTDKDTADYRPHNINPNDGGVLRASREDRASYTGCSAAYAVERGDKVMIVERKR